MALSLSTTTGLQEAHRNHTLMPSGTQTEGAEMRGGRNGKEIKFGSCGYMSWALVGVWGVGILRYASARTT